MSFWSKEKFIEQQKKVNIITPFYDSHMSHSAYELAVGPEAFITSHNKSVKIDIGLGGQIVIPSGQFSMLLTEEEVSIPLNAIGFISIRAGTKFSGLINVSGFHVDPGYKGRLKFAVYNAGSQDIVLTRQERIFLLWLSSLDKKTKGGYANKEGQSSITSKDIMKLQGKVSSPANLKNQIDKIKIDIEKLSSSNKTKFGIIFVLLVPILVGMFLVFLRVMIIDSSHQPQVNTDSQRCESSSPIEKRKKEKKKSGRAKK